jgi:calcium-dependent protein kinase
LLLFLAVSPPAVLLHIIAAVRPTAQQLLEHPWFSQAGEDGQGSVLPEGNMSHVVARLEAFAGMSRMKRLALSILCHTVTDRHITRLKVR